MTGAPLLFLRGPCKNRKRLLACLIMRSVGVLLLPAGSLLSPLLFQVTDAWETYNSYPPSVYIQNRTIYWGCDDMTQSGESPAHHALGLPIPPRPFVDVPCTPDGPTAPCDQQFSPTEAFLFVHRFLGNSNYFHFWATDYLPLLSLIMGQHEFALPTPDCGAEKVNEIFVERLERDYKLFAFAPIRDPRNPTDYFFCKQKHINFLLRLFADDATFMDDEKVYCFERGTRLWPLVSGMAIEGHQGGNSTKYAGLVWQTQLYVRQKIFGHSPEICPDCATRDKPVLVWVERPKYVRNGRLVAPERYMHSWAEILEKLRDEFDIRTLNAEEMEPQELVELLGQADILFGVHGAGLQNMVWMRPYCCVVEIRWPKSKEVDRHYQQMSTHLHHFWFEVELYHLNATQFMTKPMPAVDQQRIINAVRKAWEEMKSFHSDFLLPGGSMDDKSRDEL